jgi:hypothetical protein
MLPEWATAQNRRNVTKSRRAGLMGEEGMSDFKSLGFIQSSQNAKSSARLGNST